MCQKHPSVGFTCLSLHSCRGSPQVKPGQVGSSSQGDRETHRTNDCTLTLYQDRPTQQPCFWTGCFCRKTPRLGFKPGTFLLPGNSATSNYMSRKSCKNSQSKAHRGACFCSSRVYRGLNTFNPPKSNFKNIFSTRLKMYKMVMGSTICQKADF